VRRPRLTLLAAVVLVGINLRTVIASLPPLLPEVRADLGLSATVAGLLTTLPVVCFGALAPVAPRLGRRMPLERVLAACAAATAIATGVRGLGGTAALFAGSLFSGAAVGIAQAALPAIFRLAFPQATGLLTGAFSMALPLGATLGAALAVPLADAAGGWEASLAAWALPAVLAALLWLPATAGRRTLVRGRLPEPLRREPLAWWVALFMGVQSTAFYAALAWLPEILRDREWSAEAAGALLALSSLVSMLPAFAAPVLAFRRRHEALLVTATVAVAAAGVIGLMAAPAAAPAWMVLLGLGQGGALGLGLSFPVLRAAGAGAVASMTAMALTVGYLMASTGPWILGAAHDLSGGWTLPLAVLLAITLLELVPGLAAAGDRPRR
jgi:CP family cyanate transporter-like MFS transporter